MNSGMPELLAVVLACVLGPILLALHVLLFRWQGEEASGHFPLYAAFAGYLGAWALAAWGIWGAATTLGQSIAGLSTCVFGCLAYMQVYSQICRGFSLRILVDVDRCGGLTLDGILCEYADGRGARWLLDKRIDTLCDAGLLLRRGDSLAIAGSAGRMLGLAGVAFKRIVKPAQGG